MNNAQAHLLTTDQVAQYCSVSIGTVDSWLTSGRLYAQRSGNEHLITRHDLVLFMHHNHLAIPLELQHQDLAHEGECARVVVVDEDRPMAMAIERVLRNMGLDVIQINSGEAASVGLVQYRPQLVTVDLRLEGISGVELIQQICNDSASRPKILVITDGMPSLLHKARAAGADATLSKPFDNDALRRNVRILLAMGS